MQVSNIRNTSNNINFNGSKNKVAKDAFNWLADNCELSNNGSVKRATFVAIATLFMLGGRYFESRDKDEKREVLVRDVPAIFVSVFLVPAFEKITGKILTKRNGISIITHEPNKKGEMKPKLASSDQLKHWYTNLKDAPNPLMDLSELIDRNKGNVRKVLDKFGLKDKLDAVVGKDVTDNKQIIDKLKTAKESSKELFKNLEGGLKTASENINNSVIKQARRSSSRIKAVGILFTAATLGWLLPKINIDTTRKKYLNKDQSITNQPQNIQTSNVNFKSSLTEAQKRIFANFIQR